jgi:oligopeptide/dipeptide ABC transporter ATP-binding protein
MYGGTIVEEADVDSLYERPQHPYTVALLAALPRMDKRRGGERLQSIPGTPPNLIIPPVGCPFAARCQHVFDKCRTERPPLTQRGATQKAACWLE